MSLVFTLFHILNLSPAEFTPAILLIVEVIFAQQLVAALLQSALSPVLIPEGHVGHCLFGLMTRTIDLLQALPATGGQRSGKIFESKLPGLLCCHRQPQGEALLAPPTPLWLALKTADTTEPLLMVVVAVDPSQSQTLGMPLTLVLTDFVFLAGPYIGIIIE